MFKKVYTVTNENNGNNYKVVYSKWISGDRKLVGSIQIFLIEKIFIFNKDNLVCEFIHGSEQENEITKELEKIGYSKPFSILFPTPILFIEQEILGALAVNDTITIDLLKSFSEASPSMKVEIIKTMKQIRKKHKEMKSYPEDEIAERKIQAAKAYIDMISLPKEQKD